MNINEIISKYDKLLSDQKETLKTMDKLITLAETLLYDLQSINGGNQDAIKSQDIWNTKQYILLRI